MGMEAGHVAWVSNDADPGGKRCRRAAQQLDALCRLWSREHSHCHGDGMGQEGGCPEDPAGAAQAVERDERAGLLPSSSSAQAKRSRAARGSVEPAFHSHTETAAQI